MIVVPLPIVEFQLASEMNLKYIQETKVSVAVKFGYAVRSRLSIIIQL